MRFHIARKDLFAALFLTSLGAGGVAVAGNASPEQGADADVTQCLDWAGDYQSLAEACARAIAADRSVGRELAELYDAQGWALSKLYDDAASLEAHRRAVEIDPTYANAWRNYGWELGGADRWTEALQAAEKSIALEPEDDNGYDLKGWALRHLDRPEEAREALQIALALDIDDWTMREMGWTYWSEGRYASAATEMRRAIGQDPQDAWNHYSLGYVLDDLDQLQDAVAAFDRAIALDDTTPRFFRWRGYSLERLGEYEQALADFDRALELDVTYLDVLLDRGWVLLDLDRPETAEGSFEAATFVASDDEEGYYGLAAALIRQGKIDDGMAQLEKALNIRHDATDAAAVLAALLKEGAVIASGRAAVMINRAARRLQ